MRLRTALSALGMGFCFSLVAGQAAANPSVIVKSNARASQSLDPVANARRILAASPKLTSVTLDAPERFNLKRSTVVKFSQTHLGVPVLGRGAAVLFDAAGRRDRLATARVETTLPASATPALSATSAALRASKAVGVSFGAQHGQLLFVPVPGGARLAYGFYRGVVAGAPYAPAVVIDANSGGVILSFNAARFDRQASVYSLNPVASPSVSSVMLDALPAGATQLKNDLVSVFNCIDRKNTTPVYGSLQMHTCDFEPTAAANADGDFDYPPDTPTAPEDAHAEVAMFYHVSKVYSYLQLIGMPLLKQQPLNAVVNLRMPQGYDDFDRDKLSDPDLPLLPFDNAFFSPESPFGRNIGPEGAGMWFGQGTSADFAYDGDVVYHEFGHAMVDRTIDLSPYWHLDEQGASMAPGAMNEGLADYFSSAVAGDGQVGEFASSNFNEPYIRDLDGPDSCPAFLAGESHADSTFFAGALWTARQALPEADRQTLDEALMTALVAAPSGDLGFDELSELFVSAVEASPLGAAGKAVLSDELARRGVLPTCHRMFEYEGKSLKSAHGNLRNSFVSPGLQMVPVPFNADYAPGGFQIHQALDEDDATLEVSFEQVDDRGGLSGGYGNATPFEPMILVRFDDEIRFSYAAGISAEGAEEVTPTKAGLYYSAKLDIPLGSKDVYVMLVNRGEADGLFSNVSLFTRAAPKPPPTGSGGTGGMAGAPAVNLDPSDDNSLEGGGCGCSLPESNSSGTAAGLLGLLLAAAGLRRRRR